MIFNSLLVVGLAFRLVLGQSAPNVTISDVGQAFISFGIVPDVLSSFNPMAILNVVFRDQAANTSIDVIPGMNLTVEQTLLEPHFFLSDSGATLDNHTFVLVMVDPDAPTPQNRSLAQIRHIVAGDLLVNGTMDDDLGASLTNTSAALTDFLNPTPPAGSGPHRYTILLFVQPPDFDTTAPHFVNASTPRTSFNLTTFSQEVGLGSPVAGNFFLTGPENVTNTTSSPSSSSSSTHSSVPHTSTTPNSGIIGTTYSYMLALSSVAVVLAGCV